MPGKVLLKSSAERFRGSVFQRWLVPKLPLGNVLGLALCPAAIGATRMHLFAPRLREARDFSWFPSSRLGTLASWRLAAAASERCQAGALQRGNDGTLNPLPEP
jgi:hypothetical protein